MKLPASPSSTGSPPLLKPMGSSDDPVPAGSPPDAPSQPGFLNAVGFVGANVVAQMSQASQQLQRTLNEQLPQHLAVLSPLLSDPAPKPQPQPAPAHDTAASAGVKRAREDDRFFHIGNDGAINPKKARVDTQGTAEGESPHRTKTVASAPQNAHTAPIDVDARLALYRQQPQRVSTVKARDLRNAILLQAQLNSLDGLRTMLSQLQAFVSLPRAVRDVLLPGDRVSGLRWVLEAAAKQCAPDADAPWGDANAFWADVKLEIGGPEMHALRQALRQNLLMQQNIGHFIPPQIWSLCDRPNQTTQAPAIDTTTNVDNDTESDTDV
ncbi:hypothetical protein [Hydrogenophaga sp.]|uniref:hypothetical protein n=1 Tax=Hydrogenophaga sp. TaxID=1904254 RepID=UPI00271621E9|nr:hypothetical protein [Hydrogenophaga sp.]MDO9437351.1 hypothetical protein [Hydrogenophaga sp.]